MRLFVLLFTITAVAMAQKAPAPPPPPPPLPTGPKGPVLPGDGLGFDIRLALTGRVVLDDRQPPSEPVPVEYSCRGASRAALTDSKGKFAIVIGQQQVARTSLANAITDVEGCHVQIKIPGFEEVLITLKRPHGLADLNLGDIALKSAGKQGNAVFSESGRTAPSKARSNYVHALEAINSAKLPEAVSFLDKAINTYPQYAAALQLKGYVLEMMGQREAARDAYQKAVAADPAYAKPLVQLADMAAEEQNAAEAARWASMANKLVPGAYPGVYLTEGTAYFNLGRVDDAEKAAHLGIEADPNDIYPGLRRLMGELQYQKHNYAAALEQFEEYLKAAPDAEDIESVKERAQTSQRMVSIMKK